MFTKPPHPWNNLSYNEKHEYLQQLADEISARDGREPIPINLGATKSDYDSKNQCININNNFVALEEPYAAIESLFHESTHAQQRNILDNHPERIESPEKLQNFRNNDLAYQDQSQNEFIYRMQPLEADARQNARAEMEQLFGNQNNTAYETHRSMRDAYDHERDQDGIDHVNRQPQFEKYSGTAQDKVNQYIAEQARTIQQQTSHNTNNTEVSQPTDTHNHQAQEHDETQNQQVTQGRRR
jgi:hypothetical protein